MRGEGGGVLRGRLTRSQTLIVSDSMSSTRSSPTIRSLGVGGWVFSSRSDLTCWLEVTAALSMMWHAAGTVDPAGIEPKQMSMGLARMSAMLTGKITPDRATMLHSEFPIAPTWCANCQGVRPGQIRKGATQAVCRLMERIGN